MSASGKEVLFLAAAAAGQKFEFSLTGLPAGLYLLEGRSPSGRILRKLMLR